MSQKSKSAFSVLQKHQLDKIKHMATQITPLSVMAARLDLPLHSFYQVVKEDHIIKNAILVAEWDRYLEEEKNYKAHHDSFVSGQKLTYKISRGNLSILITPVIFDAVLLKWKMFEKNFDGKSLTMRLKKAEDRQEAKGKTVEDTQAQHGFIDWRKAMIDQADLDSGVKGRRQGDLTFRIEHYKLIDQKNLIEGSDAQPQIEKLTSKILILPDNPPDEVKKIILF